MSILSWPKTKIMETSERTTSIGLARYAKEFLEAALAVDDIVGMQEEYQRVPPIPVLYLVGHSIELALKAFLVHKGTSVSELRSRAYGHDLVKCWEKSIELGLAEIYSYTSDQTLIIRLLNELYSKKELEYIVTGYKEFPVFGPLEKLAITLVNTVGPFVGFNRKILREVY